MWGANHRCGTEVCELGRCVAEGLLRAVSERSQEVLEEDSLFVPSLEFLSY